MADRERLHGIYGLTTQYHHGPNMRRIVEEPVVTPEPNERGTVVSHPAFAQIAASRISGAATLYGSDFKHQNYVRIRIAKSMLRRHLANDWPYATLSNYIEVDLSEAQWATFVSSMNTGGGTQCTLRALVGEEVAELPPPADRQKQFAGEVTERMERARKSLTDLNATIDSLKLSEKAKGELRDGVRHAAMDIGINIEFVAGQFDEHMEATVEKAKIEINAYATNHLMQLGLDAAKGLSLGFRPGDERKAIE